MSILTQELLSLSRQTQELVDRAQRKDPDKMSNEERDQFIATVKKVYSIVDELFDVANERYDTMLEDLSDKMGEEEAEPIVYKEASKDDELVTVTNSYQTLHRLLLALTSPDHSHLKAELGFGSLARPNVTTIR